MNESEVRLLAAELEFARLRGLVEELVQGGFDCCEGWRKGRHDTDCPFGLALSAPSPDPGPLRELVSAVVAMREATRTTDGEEVPEDKWFDLMDAADKAIDHYPFLGERP